MLYFEGEPGEERLNEAVALARRGVELDDQDAITHFTHGRALLARKAYDHALAELQSALELNPNLAIVYCGLGDSLAYEGRFADAIPFFEKAISLSPYDPQRWAFYSYRALAHLLAGEFQSAVEWSTKAPGTQLLLLAVRSPGLGARQPVSAVDGFMLGCRLERPSAGRGNQKAPACNRFAACSIRVSTSAFERI